MKKYILVLIFTSCIFPVFAQGFFEPEWSEFCPQKYENMIDAKWYNTNSAKYWAERRKKFEKRLAICKSLKDEAKLACYKDLREIENNATQMYTSRKTSNALKYMMINSMF